MQKNGSASIRNMPTCFAERSYPKRAFPETDIRFGESAFSVLFLRQPLQSGANIPFQQRGHAFGVTGKVRAQERLSGSRKAARAGCCKLGQPLNAPACSGRLFVCDVGKIPLRGGEKIMRKRQVERLKQRLQEAVVREEYELAADIRDQIKELEEKTG